MKSTWPGVSIRLISTSFQGKVTAGGVDRDAPFLLLGIVIGDGGALIDLAHAVAEAAVEQHPLGDGGLAGIDVGDDADVAEVWRSVDMAGFTNLLQIENCKLQIANCG